MTALHEDLYEWQELVPHFKAGALLLGNGASIAVSSRFRYSSLLERARSEVEHRLGARDLALFAALDTSNFERVLLALRHAEVVQQAIGKNPAEFQAVATSVRTALVEAVGMSHVRHADVGVERLRAIGSSLRDHPFVFTTNYDLLTYWALMLLQDETGHTCIDYFYSDSDRSRLVFTPARSEPHEGRPGFTALIWLHGAIHLREDEACIRKDRAAQYANLLDKFASDVGAGQMPLFVSEGLAADKARAVARSPYLDYAFRKFQGYGGPLTVFGSGLDDSDEHLMGALRRAPDLAVSIHASSRANADMAMNRIKSKLPLRRIHFFEAATHPLANPGGLGPV